MHPDRAARVERLFREAAALAPDERDAYLDEACAGDPDLRAEIVSLLDHADDDFLERPEHVPALGRERLEDDVPERIGDYRILERLGSGGMGDVFLARQESPVRRRVALKRIKLGMDTREVVARFDGERQALALMNHPNIAHVYDAGATEQGRPYFVMEYVDGVPITKHCDTARLDVAGRLELFLHVCDAIQHAHQKGVIHRDIKPSNVLVAHQDGRAVPKVIDFGIAKATDTRQAVATVYTELGRVVGTPEYMSPEQAELGSQDVDTRTDVYSLGVVLYELLAGALPFDPTELRRVGFDELRRRIREDDPPRPSQRFTSLGDASPEIARRRRTDPSTYLRELRGDLDWIVMKALDKDRSQRYGSAAELADDVRRYLADEPVLARPPGTAYRVRKFVRRHRIGVAFSAAVLVLLVAGLVGTGVGLVRALHAERVARQAERTARTEAITASAALDFLVGLFEDADPSEGGAAALLASDLLDEGAASLGAKLADQPKVRGRLLLVIGKAYRALGRYDEARRLLQESVAIHERTSGPASLELVQGWNEIGATWQNQERFDKAIDAWTRAAEIAEQLDPSRPEDLVPALNNLADAHLKSGDLHEARARIERAFRVYEALADPDPMEQARLLGTLGNLRIAEGDTAGAIEAMRRSLAIRKAVAAANPQHARPRDVGWGHFHLAEALRSVERYDEAADEYAAAVTIWERPDVLGPDHEHIPECTFRLAEALRAAGRLDEAGPRYERAIELEERIYGRDHVYVAERLDGYALYLREAGRPDEARRVEARIAAIRGSQAR